MPRTIKSAKPRTWKSLRPLAHAAGMTMKACGGGYYLVFPTGTGPDHSRAREVANTRIATGIFLDVLSRRG